MKRNWLSGVAALAMVGSLGVVAGENTLPTIGDPAAVVAFGPVHETGEADPWRSKAHGINRPIVGQGCIEQGQTCTLYGTPCCAPHTCQGKFPNTTCQ